MNFFYNLKIKHKLILIIVFQAVLTLIGFTAYIIITDINTFKQELVNNASLIAKVTSNNIISELTFEDKTSAEETLQKLSEIPYIKKTIVYNKNGEIFATYNTNNNENIEIPNLKENQFVFKNNFLHFFQPIMYQNEKYGDIYFVLSTEELNQKIFNFMRNIIIFVVILIIISLLMASKLQNVISGPIIHLTEVAKKVSEEANYTLRVTKKNNDEIGNLYDMFNDMLEQICKREIARDKSEHELEQARKFLSNVINSMPSMLISIDSNGKITQWNEAAKEITKVNSTDAIGKYFWEVVPYFEKYKNFYREIIFERKPKSFHREQIKFEEDNIVKYQNVSLFPLVEDDFEGMVIRVDDITEIEKKEQQLRQAQKMETVGTLAGGLAHDFNNVLGGIIGTLSLLKFKMKRDRNMKIEEIENNLSTIEESAQRASDMVQQLLTLSRKQELSFAPVDLNLTIKHVMKICQNTFDKCIELEAIYSDVRPMVHADPTQMEQVLLNLCVNASHAMTIMRKEGEHQGGKLTVSIEKIKADKHFCASHAEATEGEYWNLSVRDTGVGMDSKTISKIFDPFFTTKGKGKGTGLGLAMVYNIIQQHKGFIDVYSEVGLGSTFNVYLPVYNREDLIDGKKDEEEIYQGNGELILVVDDELIMRQTAKGILEECGYKVIFAENGEEGIRIYKERYKDISLILLDMVMPKKSGKEVFMEIKAFNPNVNVLLSSGFKQDERVEDVLKLGVKGFVQKPYTLDKLTKAVYQVLNS